MTTLEIVQQLFQGFGMTLLIFAITLMCSLPLGLMVSFGLRSKFKPLKGLVSVFVWIIRGTPLMLQIFIIFYGPGLLEATFGINLGALGKLDEIAAVSIAFSINYACYFGVIFKGGIDSISKGQYEACQLLGMTKSQTFKHVVFPQVYKRILPPMSNEIITLVKDTSLANVIGISELIFAGKIMMNKGLILPFFSTAFFYLAFVGLLTILFGILERRSNRYS